MSVSKVSYFAVLKKGLFIIYEVAAFYCLPIHAKLLTIGK
jgi:hypothetical protein